MNARWGRIVALGSLILLACSLIPSPVSLAESTQVTIMIDGKRLDTNPPAFIVNGRTLVPMRAVLEALGAKVDWDNDAKTALGATERDWIAVPVGKKEVLRDGQSVSLDVPAMIREGRTFLPLRFTAEALGGLVEWDQETRTAWITSPDRASDAEVDEILRSRGFPDSQLRKMRSEVKREMAREMGLRRWNAPGAPFSYPGNLLPAGTPAPDNKYKEMLSLQRVPVSIELIRDPKPRPGFIGYWINFFWRWEGAPWNRRQDMVAIGWYTNGPGFVVDPDRTESRYSVKAATAYPDWEMDTFTICDSGPYPACERREKVPSVQTANGIAFPVDLVAWGDPLYNDPDESHSGILSVYIHRPLDYREPLEHQMLTVAGRYFHLEQDLDLTDLTLGVGGSSDGTVQVGLGFNLKLVEAHSASRQPSDTAWFLDHR